MTDATTSISFAVEGHAVRLSGPGQWAGAIDRGDLTEESRIVVEEDGEEIFAGSAKDYEPLADLFPKPPAPAEPAPEPTPEPAPETPVERPAPSGPVASAQPVGASWSARAKAERSVRPQTPIASVGVAPSAPRPAPTVPPTTPPPGKGSSGKGGLGSWVVGIILLFGLLFLLARCGADSGAPVSRYVEIETGVADRANGATVGTALRDDVVTVRIPTSGATPDWLEVEGGPFDGQYIRSEVLSAVKRPVIEPTGVYRTIRGMGVRVRSEPAGDQLDLMNTGDEIFEIGRTSDGWSEIQRPDGVGYVSTALTRRARR